MNMIWLAIQEGAETPNVFNLTENVSFWTIVIFLVLLTVLWRYAYPPILGYAEAREKRIQAALDEAKRQREEAERFLQQQRQELAEAKQQAQQLIAEGKQAAERVRQELLERTRHEQTEVVVKATREIERERQRAVESLRHETVDLALAAAAKLIGQKVSAAEDRQLVAEYLRGMRAEPETGGSGIRA